MGLNGKVALKAIYIPKVKS